MKKIVAFLLCICIVLSGCSFDQAIDTEAETGSIQSQSDTQGITEEEEAPEFANLSDPELCSYLEENIYTDVITTLDSQDYLVQDVKTTYVSKEYLEELAYNSKSNIYFGYDLADVEKAFGDEKYIFTCDESGNTVVQKYETYDDTFDQVVQNVAVGSGVILICVTVSAVSAGVSAPAVSVIFAAAAKTGTLMAVESAAIGAAITATVTSIQTHDVNETLKQTALSASQEFKFGAIFGAVAGGAGKLFALSDATAGGLTLNEAAQIQRETKYSLKLIKTFHSVEEAEIYEGSGLVEKVINGKPALIRSIDLSYESELAGETVTNLERMKRGYPAIDPETGKAYELHHIGQKVDSPLAILTKKVHTENNKILHDTNIANGQGVHSQLSKSEWSAQKRKFWKAMGELFEKGV